MDTFKDRFRHLRLHKGLTQSELANELNLSKSLISMYESGKRTPPIDTLELICDYFNVDFAYILGESNILNSNGSAQEQKYRDQLPELLLIQENAREYIHSDKMKDDLKNNKVLFELFFPMIQSYATKRILRLFQIEESDKEYYDYKLEIENIMDKTISLYNLMLEEGLDRLIKFFEKEGEI